MATTTNYSWTTPDDTALVKDGAAAIRSLGTAIDTTVFTNAGAAIAKATVDAKGDLIAGTADNTVARLAVGANDTILVADSSTATGLKWAAPAGASGLTFISRTTFSNVATVDIDPPFNNTYETYLMIIENISCATTADDVLIRGRYSTTVYSGAEYYAANAYIKFDSTAWTWANASGATSFTLMPEANAGFPGQAAIYFANVGDASKLLSMYGNWSTRSSMLGGYIAGEINNQQTWTGIRLLSSSTNITGEVSFYGLAKA
jgi:hypothetical protein